MIQNGNMINMDLHVSSITGRITPLFQIKYLLYFKYRNFKSIMFKLKYFYFYNYIIKNPQQNSCNKIKQAQIYILMNF